MKHRLFEDSEMSDMERQVAGIGPGSREPGAPGAMRAAEYLQQKNELPQSSNDKPYPIEHIDQTLAEVFVNLSNIQKLLDVAAANPVLKDNKSEIKDLNNKIKSVADILVDFDEVVSIIKGNE